MTIITLLVIIIAAVAVCSCAVGVSAYFIYRRARSKLDDGDDDHDNNQIEMQLLDYNERVKNENPRSDGEASPQSKSRIVRNSRLPKRFNNARRITKNSSYRVGGKAGEGLLEDESPKRQELLSPKARSESKILSRTPFNSMYQQQERMSPRLQQKIPEEDENNEISRSDDIMIPEFDKSEIPSSIVINNTIPARPQAVRLKFNKPISKKKRPVKPRSSDMEKESSAQDSPSDKQ